MTIMLDKNSRKKLKQILKDISKLEREGKRIEFRSCWGDSDLKQEEVDLRIIRKKMHALEKDKDRFVFNASGVRHFQW